MLGGVGLLCEPVIERWFCQDIAAKLAVIFGRSLEKVGLTLRQCVQAVEYRLIRAGDGCAYRILHPLACGTRLYSLSPHDRVPDFDSSCRGRAAQDEGTAGGRDHRAAISVERAASARPLETGAVADRLLF